MGVSLWMNALNGTEALDEDRQEIEAILNGNSALYSNLVKKYQRFLYFMTLRMLRNAEDADEVTQKAFLKAYRALPGFRFESSFKTWLTTIALNLCRSELMKSKREMVEIPPNLADPGFENRKEQEEAEHQKADLNRLLDRLPPRQKEVVTLRIYQELPFKEIARLLKSNETAVKVNFHHAMVSLRNWIRRRGERDREL
jgi:RNA polymerase sigma-70 factor (ECF subfamily)